MKLTCLEDIAYRDEKARTNAPVGRASGTETCGQITHKKIKKTIERNRTDISERFRCPGRQSDKKTFTTRGEHNNAHKRPALLSRCKSNNDRSRYGTGDNNNRGEKKKRKY